MCINSNKNSHLDNFFSKKNVLFVQNKITKFIFIDQSN